MATWHPWRALRSRTHLHVHVEDLERGQLGQLDFNDDTIRLACDQTQAQRRSTLTHELVHDERGPVPDDPRLAAREELAVELESARRLITLEELVVGILWSQDEVELAEELWVDVATVRARLAGLTDEEKRYVEDRVARREESA